MRLDVLEAFVEAGRLFQDEARLPRAFKSDLAPEPDPRDFEQEAARARAKFDRIAARNAALAPKGRSPESIQRRREAAKLRARQRPRKGHKGPDPVKVAARKARKAVYMREYRLKRLAEAGWQEVPPPNANAARCRKCRRKRNGGVVRVYRRKVRT